jgi:hypothetical protein
MSRRSCRWTCKYRWCFSEPLERLFVNMQNHERGEQIFDATLSLRAQPVTARRCSACCSVPLDDRQGDHGHSLAGTQAMVEAHPPLRAILARLAPAEDFHETEASFRRRRRQAIEESVSALTQAARKLLLGQLRKIRDGRLRLIDGNRFARVLRQRDGGGPLDVTIRVRSQRFYSDVVFAGTVGSARRTSTTTGIATT